MRFLIALNSLNQPYSCTQWGNVPNGGSSQIIHDTSSDIFWMFESQSATPSTIWIDHNMVVYDKMNGAGSWSIGSRIDDMYEACELAGLCGDVDIDNDGLTGDSDNCPNDYNPNQLDSDGDELGDECDDCHNLLGDIDDDGVHDILDLVKIVNIILSGGTNSVEFSDCEKGDADFDGNGTINILDVIQMINVILSNGRSIDNNEIGNASVDFQTVDNDLYINIDSNKDFSGVQLSLTGEFINIDLLNNSHIQLSSRVDNGITRMVAYSLLNDSFDGHQATFIINNAHSVDISDVNIMLADKNGNAIITTQSMDSEIYQSGPYQFDLSSVYPNPFNPSTEINFSVPSDSYVRLSVYNVQGQEVDVIHEGFQSVGAHSYTWNASNMSSGVYYVRLLSGNKAKTMKAVLMK